MKIFIFLLLLGYGWASFLPNGCPADFSVHILLPHETDCTKFYQCSNGHKFTMQCPRGTAFDVELQTCNWADEVDCNRPDQSTSTTTIRVPSTTTRAPSTTTGAPTTTTPAPPGLPNECPSDFDVVLKLPHEIDCDKYYNCSDGIKILLNCPTGKYFDMKLQNCDWSQNVDCANVGGERGGAGLLPNGCPADFHIHKLLPHETNCSKFYYCNFGNKIERECSGNLHFNPKLQVCDWPESAGCVSEGGDGGEWLPNGCPSDFSVHWLLPHETDCAKFYYCNFGEKVVRSCPSGTHFDPKLQVCNWPNAVNCTSIETTTRPDTTIPSIGTTKEYITTTTMENTEPSLETTTEYIPTTTRETTEPSVETTTEYIPTTTKETTEPSVETTTEYIPTTTKETTEPSVETTTEYIPTTTRETTEPSVETTTEYIPTTTKETTEPSVETTTEYIPTTVPTTTQDTTKTPVESTSVTTTESIESTTPINIECPPGMLGFVPHPDYCDAYYICVRGIPTLMWCSKGEEFDPDRNICVEISEDGCFASQGKWTPTIPDTTPENLATTTESDRDTTTIAADTTTENLATTTESDRDTTTMAADTTTENLATTTESDRDTTTIAADATTENLATSTESDRDTTTIAADTTTENLATTTESDRDITTIAADTTTEDLATTTESDRDTTTIAADTTTENLATTTESDRDTTTIAADTTTENLATTTESIETTTPINIECPPGMLGFVPHPDYCDAYYVCVMGIPTLTWCSEGYEFDPNVNSCVVISEDGCFASKEKSTPTDPDATTTTGTTIEPIQTTTEAALCPPGFLGHVPHPEYCDKYYLCIRGIPQLQHCNAGFEFDPELRICVEISEDGCFASQGKWTPTIPDTTTEDLATTTESDRDTTTIAADTTTENFVTTTESDRDTTTIAADTTTENLATTTESDRDITTIAADTTTEDLATTTESDRDTTTIAADTTTENLATTTESDRDTTTIAADTTTENLATTTESDRDITTIAADTTTENLATTTESDRDTTTIAADTTTENLATTTESIETTTPINIECPPGMLGFVPHPDYCDAYYVCVMGIPTLTWCSEGYEFDPNVNSCVVISEDGCFASKEKSTPTDPDATTTTGTTIEPIQTTTEAALCPPGFLGHVPHPEYCDKYYLCIRGIPQLQHCNAGFEFDPELRICVEISEDGCFASQGKWTPTIPDTTPENLATTTESDRDTTTIAADTTTENLATTTESDRDTTTMAADTTTENLATTTESDRDTTTIAADATTENLATSTESDRDTTTIAADTTTENLATTTESDRDISTIAADTTTEDLATTTESDRDTTTIATTENLATTTESDRDTTTIAADTTTENLATTTESIETTTPINIECPPGMLGFVPHPDYCDAYYVCVMGIPTLTWCSEGYEFDPNVNSCVVISEDGCFASKEKSTPTDPDATTTTGTTIEPIQTTTEAALCPPGFLGHVPHPEYCDKYYLCIRGIPQLQHCSAGFEFDPELRVCVEISENGCFASQGKWTPTIPDTTTEDLATTTESDRDTTTIAADTTTENFATTTESDRDTTTIAADTTTENLATTTESDRDITTIAADTTTEDLATTTESDRDTTTIAADTTTENLATTTESDRDTTTIAADTTTENLATTTESDRDITTIAADTTTENLATTTESDRDTTTIAADTTTENLATTTESIETTTPINIECPPGMLGFVPHPDYCDAYYVCVMGIPTLTWCSEGYEFDPNVNSCVVISEDGCFASKEKSTPTDPDATTTTGTTIEPIQTTTEAALCPPGFLGHVPHPEYCDKYYLCIRGIPQLQHCNAGFEFDPELRICVEISEDGCFASQGKWTPTIPDTTPENLATTTESDRDTTTIAADTTTENLATTTESDRDTTTMAADTTTENLATTTESDRDTTTIAADATTENLATSTESDRDTTTIAADTTTENLATTTESDRDISTIAADTTTEDLATTTESDRDTTTIATTENLATTTESDRDTTTIAADTTTENLATTTESIETTTPINIECPPGMLGFVPHPDYCDAYYVCVMGIPTLTWCSEGYEFDPNVNSCVVISEDGCFASKEKSTPTDPDATTTTGTTIEPIQTTTEAALCPPGFLGHVPHPEYCDKYYLCIRGIPQLQHCSAGFEFDPELRVCVEISENGCFASQGKWTPTIPDTTTEDLATTTESDRDTTTIAADTTTENFATTTESDRDTTTIAADTTTENLATTTESDRDITTIAADTTTEDLATTTESDRDTTTIAADTTTENLATTTESDRDTTTIAADTTTENLATTTESIETTTPINIECPPGMLGFVPHPDYCDAYYVCVMGIPTLTWCSEGYEFDPNVNSCVVISEDGCFASKEKSTPTDPDATTTTGTTIEPIQTTTEAALCPPGFLGHVPHPEYCDKYYLCIRGIPQLQHCSAGFEFDPELRVCVEISENGCFASQGKWTPTVPDQSTTETTITTDHYGSTTESTEQPTEGTSETPKETTTDSDSTTVILTTKPSTEESTTSGTTVDSVETTTGVTGTTVDSIESTTGVAGTTVDSDETTTGVTGTTVDSIESTTGVTGTTVDSIDTTTGATGNTVDSDETTTGVTGTTVDSIYTTTGATGTTVDSIESTTGVTGTTVDSIESTTGVTGTTVVLETTTPPSICPPGVFGNVPHPELCDVYYMCIAGMPTLLPCTEGYEFDPTVGQCVVISENGCFASKGMWTPTEQHPTTTESSHITTDISQTTTKDSIETTTGGSGTTDDSMETTTGATGTTVDSIDTTTGATGTTVGSDDTTIGITGTTDDSMETTTAGSDTTVDAVETTTGASDTTADSMETTTPPSICPPGVFGNVPHPELCDVYYMCIAGMPTLLPCTEGYEFDPTVGQCVVISENGCFASKGMWTPTEQHPTTTESSHMTTDISQTTTKDSIETTTGGSGTTDDSIETTTGATGTTVDSIDTTTGATGNTVDSIDTTTGVTGTTVDSIDTTTGATGTTVVSDDTTIGVTGTTDDSIETTTAGSGTTVEAVETTTGASDTTVDSLETTTRESGTTVVTETTTPPSICPPGVFGNIPHPELCDVYYMCMAGIPTLLPCTEGYEFDSTAGQCVVISENGCFASKGMWTPTESHSTTDSSYVTTEVSQAATEETTLDDKLSTTDLTEGEVTTAEPIEITTEELGTTTLPAVTTPANLCPPGVFGNVPHPELCDVYYMCMAGVPTLLPCSKGYEFDSSLGQCVVISENGCFASKGMWTPTESNDHTDTSVQSTINEDAERTAEEKDITDSSTIDNNKPGDQETTSVLIPTTGEDGQITTELIETTTINVCPPNFSGIVPDPERCDRFFHCTVGHPIALYCGAGFEFDINTQSCVPITEDGCYASKGLWTPTESQTTEQATQQPEVTTDADISTTISDLIIGDNDKPTTDTSDETAPEDDGTGLETTASPIEVTTASICPPGVFGNVPDPDRCDKFYMCTAGTAIPLYCGKGFEFDPKDQQCVIISENGCFASRGLTSEDRTEGYEVTTDNKMKENLQTTQNVEITSEDTQTTTAICPPGVFGNVPDPENCNKFYMCTAGISIPLYCSAGFEFDPVVKDCVIISDHGCTASKS
ncbi:mucin-5AC-like isoform X5 [Nymphalis io]|uniref:mucin-5AC-like isoform X5 n=1 Tax=Inachis io TaxID=171585 RepID=UPI002167B793|nr:mucin-5AC-like isoform X5 [Nymphalis io]